jgi:glucosamine-6-phosphate deaminase
MLLKDRPTLESEIADLPPQVYQTLSMIVAKIVADLLKEKPDACLGLPTGRTPLACYEYLSASSAEGGVDWRQARCFGLDDYVDCDEQHSFRYFLNEHLYRHTNVSPENRFNPIFCDNYDELIESAGGLDLCILGLGRNGHIAFNEPGTPPTSWTHTVILSESTRQANAEFFVGGKIPSRGVTMGISTILASRRIILMVTGGAKKEILTRAMRGPVTSDVPASFLQGHKNVMVLADFDY